MITDPKRIRFSDPGHPDECNVYYYRTVFETGAPGLHEECTGAKLGCTDCKLALAKGVNAYLEPLRERRAALAARPADLHAILDDGARRAGDAARRTYEEAFAAMKLRRAR